MKKYFKKLLTLVFSVLYFLHCGLEVAGKTVKSDPGPHKGRHSSLL